MKVEINTLVTSIFTSNNLSHSIADYILLAEKAGIYSPTKTKNGDLADAIGYLKRCDGLRNPSTYSHLLLDAVQSLNHAASHEKNVGLLIAELGLMMCYLYLGERQAMLMARERVATATLSRGFWRKNKGRIAHAGMLALGAALAMAGRGKPLVAVGSQTGSKLNDDHQASLQSEESVFTGIKNAIIGLQL